MYCFLTCLTTIYKSPKACKPLAPFLIASNNSWTNDSYSVTLFVHGNWSLWAASYASPFGLINSKPAPTPFLDLDPSNLRVQTWAFSGESKVYGSISSWESCSHSISCVIIEVEPSTWLTSSLLERLKACGIHFHTSSMALRHTIHVNSEWTVLWIRHQLGSKRSWIYMSAFEMWRIDFIGTTSIHFNCNWLLHQVVGSPSIQELHDRCNDQVLRRTHYH